MSYPLVSVIINNYNYAIYLSEAIESVLFQSYRNFELIIVDDGSTDHSKDIINEYHQLYADVIIPIYKQNGGQASAFNAGIKKAHGEIIAFLDSDDYWFDNKLETIVKYHDKYGMVQHNLLKNNLIPYTELSVNKDYKMVLKKYGFQGTIPTSGLSLKAEVLRDIYPIPEKEMRICADLFILWHAFAITDVYSINESLGYYRVHDRNRWYNNRDPIIRQKVIEELNKRFEIIGLNPVKDNPSARAEVLADSIKLSKNHKYIIYGTGQSAEYMLKRIYSKGSIVLFFSDSDPEKWGTLFMGIKIISPDELVAYQEQIDFIVIGSMYMTEIKKLLLERNIRKEKLLIPSL